MIKAAQIPGGALGSILLVVLSLILAFAGKTFAKVVVFLLGGASLGLLLYYLGNVMLGSPLSIIIGIVGFVLGGLLGVLLLPVAVGFGLALVLFTIGFSLGGLLAGLLAGLLGFIIGFMLHNPILAFVTSAIAGYLLYVGLSGFDIDRSIALVAGVILFIVGLLIQLR
ncbi:hypothetical protein ATG_10450 [Desulfurococcaceae archaeon AG1]|jgi:hypothetical protein|nr:MAG: hypothetical protein DJ555_05160 [Desulfurococcaceae archaeon]GAY25842.1 hypothetical protein ATG_10450 [Desulfurococcaceae archaeon AG1]